MAGSPKISVIVPVYNAGPYLAECLDSVLSQSFTDIEVICVNDGSTDDSLKILKKYKADDNRIVIHSQPNQGLSAARNSGMKLAQGEYIQFVDADDYLQSEILKECYAESQTVEDGYDIVMFEGDAFFEEDAISEENEVFRTAYHREGFYGRSNGLSILCQMVIWSDYRVPCWLYMTKRAHLERNHIEFDVGIYHEDNWFTYISLARAGSVSALKNHGYMRRVSANTIMTSSINIQHVYGLWLFITKVLHYIDDNGMTGMERAASLWLLNWPWGRINQFLSEADIWQVGEARKLCDNFVIPAALIPRILEGVQTAFSTERSIVRLRKSPTFRLGKIILWIPRNAFHLFWKLIRKIIRRDEETSNSTEADKT
jgi:glycosyltransferase involved in cell wall biosynthesis